MEIKKVIKKVYQNAKQHGFWKDERTVGELLALIHSEVSEALEEHRNGRKINETYYSGKRELALERGGYIVTKIDEKIITKECKKPEGIPSELADIVIRVFDICGHYEIDLEAVIKEKMEYNKSRPRKHGGKTI